MKKILTVLSLAGVAALSACATTAGTDFPVANAAQIRSGVTTRAGVQQLLGPPYGRQITSSTDESWTYLFMSAKATPKAKAFIPIYGFLASDNMNAETETRQVTVMFHGEVVTECSVEIRSQSGVTSAYAIGAGSGGTTQKTSCAQMQDVAQRAAPLKEKER